MPSQAAAPGGTRLYALQLHVAATDMHAHCPHDRRRPAARLCPLLWATRPGLSFHSCSCIPQQFDLPTVYSAVAVLLQQPLPLPFPALPGRGRTKPRWPPAHPHVSHAASASALPAVTDVALCVHAHTRTLPTHTGHSQSQDDGQLHLPLRDEMRCQICKIARCVHAGPLSIGPGLTHPTSRRSDDGSYI